MKTKTLHMIGHAHIDPVWLWPWQEGFHEVKATFRSALDRMKEFDDFVFVSSSAAFYAWVEQSDPEMFAEIQARVAEGRWDLVGGWWIEPDCNIPGGESFVRHGLYAQRYFQEKFGRRARTGFNVDSFGHAATLPQILKKSGIDYYTFLRPMPHERNLPARLFWWESDDGSRVLTFRIPFEYLSWSKDVTSHALRCRNEIKEPQTEIMCFYGVGNHGGGPTVENLTSIQRLNEDPDFDARLLYSTPEAYFASALEQGWTIPVVHDELLNHARGCYSAHSGIKRWMRQAENRLMAAEKWSAAAAWVLERSYPTDFEHAWKQMLFNQFHDILAGTSLEVAYEDARNDIGETLAIAGRNLNHAVQAFAWNIHMPQQPDTRPLVVFNSLTWPVRALVAIETSRWPAEAVLVDDTGQVVPHQAVQSTTAAHRARLSFQADLPALGYRAYRLLLRGQEQNTGGAAATEVVQASDTVLENKRFRLDLDPANGTIASLRDLEHQVQVFSGPAARALVINDPGDTWGHDTFTWNDVVGEFGQAHVRLVEHGPVHSVLRAVSHYNTSTLTQDFILSPGGEWIDVRVEVDWHEHNKMLKLRFPVHVHFMRVTRDIAYGSIETFANGEEVPFQQWVDLSGTSREKEIMYGFSLINDGKYSLDVRVSDIGMTVLRSPAYAHHIPDKPVEGGSYAYIDQGIQTFHYRMMPHGGSWESAGTARRAAELNQPPVILFTTFHPDGKLPQSDSYLTCEPQALMVTVLKQAEDGKDLILRVVETSRSEVSGKIRLSHWQREIDVRCGPGEIKTLRVPRDPSQPVQETSLLEEA